MSRKDLGDFENLRGLTLAWWQLLSHMGAFLKKRVREDCQACGRGGYWG